VQISSTNSSSPPSRSAHSFTASDVVELYLHRGAFEPALSDEDQEIDPDRWCSHSAWGQECWQVVSQWVWNLRLELGHRLEPTPMRMTEFAPAIMPQSEQAAPHPASSTPTSGYGPPTTATSWKAGRSARHSGRDPVPCAASALASLVGRVAGSQCTTRNMWSGHDQALWGSQRLRAPSGPDRGIEQTRSPHRAQRSDAGSFALLQFQLDRCHQEKHWAAQLLQPFGMRLQKFWRGTRFAQLRKAEAAVQERIDIGGDSAVVFHHVLI
jgi:hypothetical protein